MASQVTLPPVIKGKEHAFCSNPGTYSPPCPAPGVQESSSSVLVQEEAVPLPSTVSVSCQTLAPTPPSSTDLSLLPLAARFPGQPLISSDAKSVLSRSYNGVTEGDLDAEEDRKPDKEHKKRSKNWSMPETLLLIKLRTGMAPRFGKTGRKSDLWGEIAEGLQKENYCRDAQQCKDKWEKLMVRYKEVREGHKDKRDNPYFDELHPFLSEKSARRDREREMNPFRRESALEIGTQLSDFGRGLCLDSAVKDAEKDEGAPGAYSKEGLGAGEDGIVRERTPLRKRKRCQKFVALTDVNAVETLLDTIISRQQRFFIDLLEAMERKEQLREQMRQEREEKWRAEERAQRCIFNNAMIFLTQKLVGERRGTAAPVLSGSLAGSNVGQEGPKKRSKNWRRVEVLQLIKLRGEMEAKFVRSVRRAALWEELAELLAAQGIERDAKQCREKWEKMMSQYKEVLDGRREQVDSPYFAELTAIVGGTPGEP